MRKLIILIFISLCYTQSIDLSLEWTIADSGFYTEKLDSVIEQEISNMSNILGVIVIQKGKVVAENYYNNSSADEIYNIWSVTKSFTSTLIGQAIDQGLIYSEDSVLTQFLPDYGVDYIESVTLDNVLSMSSGYYDYFGYNTLTTEQLVSIAHFSPGTFFYSNAACHINSHILYYGTDYTPYEFANTHLFPYLGINEPLWYSGYLNINDASVSLFLTLREMVKLGQLYLQNGFSGDTQILSSDWINKATSHKVDTGAESWGSDFWSWPSSYGYLWWLPERGYLAMGYGGQLIIVVPELDLVIGTHSTDWGPLNVNLHTSDLIDIVINSIVPIFDNSPLVINEILVTNSQSYTDENGEFDPYVEIFNCGMDSIDIGGYFVTDDIEDPESFYQIPIGNDSTIIEPEGFLLLWADGEIQEGVLHLDVELNDQGGHIGFYTHDTIGLVDSLTYPISASDLAYGRTEDCVDNWNYMDPTPNMSNTTQLNNDQFTKLPKKFTLDQNYPNPFNSVATLRYELPEDTNVNITIYDMMGRVVSNLVSSQQDAGYKSIQWNATNNAGQPVSAGLYLYTIKAGNFSQTKKMILLK